MSLDTMINATSDATRYYLNDIINHRRAHANYFSRAWGVTREPLRAPERQRRVSGPENLVGYATGAVATFT